MELYIVPYVYPEDFIQWMNLVINHCYHCDGCIECSNGVCAYCLSGRGHGGLYSVLEEGMDGVFW